MPSLYFWRQQTLENIVTVAKLPQGELNYAIATEVAALLTGPQGAVANKFMLYQSLAP
jgi:hypothetical protein